VREKWLVGIVRKRLRVPQVAARTRGSVVVPQSVTGGPARFSVLLGYLWVLLAFVRVCVSININKPIATVIFNLRRKAFLWILLYMHAW
jgi:hypothetical protein